MSMRNTAAPAAFVRLFVALALALGLTFVVSSGTPASAATDCTVTKAATTKATDRLKDLRERRARIVVRLKADQRKATRLQRAVRQHRTPAKVRALRAARAEVRVERGRLATVNQRTKVAKEKVVAARVANRLCAGQVTSEAELFDLLDTLGLSPIVETIGVPQLLVDLGVVRVLDMLGLGDILRNLGLGSLIGR